MIYVYAAASQSLILSLSRACSYIWGGGPRVVVSTAAFQARVRGSVPGHGGLKETKMFLLHPRVKVSIVGSLCDREVVCSASDRQGSNLESCVWRTVSSQSSHHPQEVLLAQFSLYVHKGGLKPDSFHFYVAMNPWYYLWNWGPLIRRPLIISHVFLMKSCRYRFTWILRLPHTWPVWLWWQTYRPLSLDLREI